jgi:hypothetical protein
MNVRLEVFMAVTMKNAIFWDVMPFGFCNNRCFRGTYHLHHQDDNELGTTLAVTSTLVTLMMLAIRCSETLALTTATWCNFLEDGILL